MQTSSLKQTKPKHRVARKQRRSRVYIHESAHASIDRRLEETGMSFSDYMRYLVRRDIGVYV